MFRDKAIETIDKSSLERLQLENLKKTISCAQKTRFYKNRLSKTRIKSPDDIRSLKDLQDVPFTTKDDLRACYPDGLLSVDKSDVVRLHTSSGTTGMPTVIYHTQADLDYWTELVSRGLTACGVTKSDIFQNMMTYGLFTGGLGLHYGAERLGALVIPAGAGNTRRQLQLMKDFHTTTLHATPNYMLHIMLKLAEFDISLKDLNLKKVFLGAEPYTENTRKKIEEFYHIDAYNCYGLSELNGPGVAMECEHKRDLHIWEDSYIVEIINPDTGEILKDGEAGELVLTTLKREATPLLRYRSRDLTRILTDTCPCGRTHRRISRITGRSDDMLIINGVNVFPSQIEEILMKRPEVGTNYQIVVDQRESLDRLSIKVELYAKLFEGDIKVLERLRDSIAHEMKSTLLVGVHVELHEPGSLPVSEGKAKRVVDERKN
ncbi:MAG: phenylacetate--CoA ligase [Candidatus Omnitrophica bacterium]|nr:phenylacetate--CoA ligase [Candidatus Omnitrophota bacterium]